MTTWTVAPASESSQPPTPAGSVEPTQPYAPREQVIRTPKCGARGQLTATTNTTVYTAPTLTENPTGSSFATALLKCLILSNTDSSARTVTAHAVESGGSVAANRVIFPAQSIAAGTSVYLTFPDDTFPLDAGEFINLIAVTANTISYRVNVVELTH